MSDKEASMMFKKRGGGIDDLNEGGDSRVHVVGLENIRDQLKAKSVLFLQSVAMW